MKLDKLVGERFKEKPSDCVIDSHALMLRGGYMKNVANGIYSQYMPLRRITKKIEDIIRDEMDKIGGQEVLFGERKKKDALNFSSPDSTSDGNLKKRWKILDGKRCLIKGGSNPFRQ